MTWLNLVKIIFKYSVGNDKIVGEFTDLPDSVMFKRKRYEAQSTGNAPDVLVDGLKRINDARLCLFRGPHMLNDWLDGARGFADSWTRASSFVAAKQRGALPGF